MAFEAWKETFQLAWRQMPGGGMYNWRLRGVNNRHGRNNRYRRTGVWEIPVLRVVLNGTVARVLPIFWNEVVVLRERIITPSLFIAHY